MKDGYGREITYMRMSVTQLCNLRCIYCMPEQGVVENAQSDMLTEDEMILAVKAAASLGVKKLRITGGEPLVKKNILSICSRAASVDGIEDLCLTTNGILLPELAVPLRQSGVRRINISLDTLDSRKYARMTRIGSLSGAVAGIRAALDAGFEKVKINTVLIGGFNDDEIVSLAQLTLHYPLDLRFIELMPMNNSGQLGPEAYISDRTVLKMLPDAAAQPPDGSVARLYRLPGAKGNIGLISPISDHFCGECNRIRLTADGKLKPCLHSAQEYPIKGLDYEQMRRQFERAILEKPAWHGELSASNRSRAGRSMNQIGG